MRRADGSFNWFVVFLAMVGIPILGVAGWAIASAETSIATPVIAYVTLVASTIIGSKQKDYLGTYSVPLASMPLDSFGLFARTFSWLRRDLGGLVIIATALGAGACVATHRALFLALVWSGSAAIAACAVFLALFPVALGRLQILWLVPLFLIFRHDNGAALLRSVGWHMTPATGTVTFLAITAVAGVATWRLIPQRVRIEPLLAWSGALGATAAQSAHDISEPETNRLRLPLTARTRSLLQLVTRTPDPEAPLLAWRGSVISMTIAMAIAWAVQLAAGTPVGFALPALFAVGVYASAMYREAGWIRSDWKHPLVESLPVSARDYAIVLLKARIGRGVAATALVCLALRLSPFQTGLLILWVVAMVGSALIPIALVLTESTYYRTNARRARMARVLQFLRRASLLVLILGVAASIVIYGFVGSALLASMAGAAFLAVVIVGFWMWTWRIHSLHDFDAEYEERTLTAGSRW